MPEPGQHPPASEDRDMLEAAHRATMLVLLDPEVRAHLDNVIGRQKAAGNLTMDGYEAMQVLFAMMLHKAAEVKLSRMRRLASMN